MKKNTPLQILTLLLLCMVIRSHAQNPKAITLLERAAKANALHADFRIKGKGIYKNDDHLKNPNQLNEFDYQFELQHWSANGDIQIDGHYRMDKFEASESILYQHEDEFIYNSDKKIYIRTHPENRTDRIKNHSFHPGLLLSFLIENKNKLTFPIAKSDGMYTIDFYMPADVKWTLKIKEKDYQCMSIGRSYFHYLYGDVSEEIQWSNYIKTPQGFFPTSWRLLNKGYEEYKIDQEIIYEPSPDFKGTTDTVIVDVPVKTEDWIISKDSIVFSKIEEGLYEIKLNQTENRLLIAEFNDFLILLEGSFHSKNGDLILDFLRQQFPDKPVKYTSFSHCHTQYIGFSRSHAANGTHIIATDDNAAYIKRLCKASFTMRPDKQHTIKGEPVFEKLVNGSWKYADERNAIEIYNIESTHTVNYLVFYFPKQKIMFVGDLLKVSKTKKEPISGRSLVFYNEVVGRLGLKIDTYYISWPLSSDRKAIVRADEIIKP